ncbi:MAG: NHLP family bacteriocin export ABC transporter peptidase/permease/ATPase subunit [Verrucomicrobiales bacterium]|nr:NHLP family bacteriocin export ABC transporter peptidase/permease/ATPase subunit [Verrucomicrobiales bacterium]
MLAGKIDIAAFTKRKKTPFIMQMEAVECGAAALAIVMGYYGRFVPLSQLRQECGVSRDGSKASNVLKAARRFGMIAKGYSKGLNKVKEVKTPFICYWEFNHFIVVEGFTKDFVYVNDPAHGHRRLSWETFGEGYTGVVLAIEPGEDFRKGGTMPKMLPVLLQHTRGSRHALAFVMICGLLATAPAVASAALTKVLLDSVIAQGHYDWLRPLLSSMALVMIFQLSLTALSGQFYRRMQMGLSARLQAKFFKKLLDLPFQFYSQRYVGDVVDRTRLVGSIVELISGRLTSAAVGVVTMVTFGMVLFAYNPLLTSIGVLATALNFIFLRMVAKRREEANIVISKDQGRVQAVTIAAIQSIDTIKASGLEDNIYGKWSGFFSAASNATLKLELESRIFSALPTLTTTVINTVTLILGGIMVMSGDMTFGTLMAFNLLMGQFLGPMSDLLSLSVQMQQIRGNVIRLSDVMDHPSRSDMPQPDSDPPAETESNPAAPAIATSQNKLDGRIEFKNVTFGYSPLEAPLIRNFDLEILPGERVALVGKSGCGKSTLAKLAAGLLTPQSGGILFSGQPRDAIPKEVIANSVAMIEQDITFFPGSILDNLTLWDMTIPSAWAHEACEDAGILDTVLALPGGLDASVAEGGGNFSGGQRQRLEIARSLVRKPSLLILDEATSALDVEMEEKVIGNIRRRGCSCLVIAHRLSTVKNCQKIVVMEQGEIAEIGSYDELWKKGGKFAALLQSRKSG